MQGGRGGRKVMTHNGDTFCNNSKRLEDYKGCNSFGCLEDYVESGDEGIDDFGFENSDVEMFHFHLDKDRRDKAGRGHVSFPSVKGQAVKCQSAGHLQLAPRFSTKAAA